MSDFQCVDIKYSYGKKNVLNGVCFEAEAGEFVGIIGANGSGKTTLVKSVCSLVKYEGQVQLFGENLSAKSEREIAELVSYIPQRSGIDIAISVLDAVLMGFNAKMSIFAQYSQKQRDQALKSLAEVGIEHLAQRNYQSLSEGEKQLCMMARSFVSEARLFVLDEPESSLDFKNRNKVIGLIRNKMKEKGSIAAVCLHEPSVALQYCDRIVLIEGGKCIAQLKPQTDSLKIMEEKLKLIYGDITLERVGGKTVMLPE